MARQQQPKLWRLAVDTTADLTTLFDARMSDGDDCWVVAAGATHGKWVLDKTSAAAIGATVVATLSGVGRWIFFGAGSGTGTGVNLGEYGDGSDGTVNIPAGNTVLARDMYYDVLTVAAGGTLVPNGFRIFCKTSATIAATGAIRCDGNAAIGVVPGARGSEGTLWSGGAGQVGATQVGGGGTGEDTFDSLGGSGGAGGPGFSGAGLPGGSARIPVANRGSLRALPQAVLGRAAGGEYNKQDVPLGGNAVIGAGAFSGLADWDYWPGAAVATAPGRPWARATRARLRLRVLTNTSAGATTLALQINGVNSGLAIVAGAGVVGTLATVTAFIAVAKDDYLDFRVTNPGGVGAVSWEGVLEIWDEGEDVPAQGGAGGGGGMGDGANPAGSGGAGGGVIVLAAKQLVVAGTISAVGGAGGAAPLVGGSGSCGGGGGGGGGVILLTRATEALTGTVVATGGAGGLGESAGVLNPAFNGVAGAAGAVVRLDHG